MKKIIFIITILISTRNFAAELNITSVVASAVFTQPAYSNPQPTLPGISYQRILSDSGQHIARRLPTDIDKDSTPYLFYAGDTLNQRVSGVVTKVGQNLLNGFIPYGGTGITTGSISYVVAAGAMIDKIIFFDPSTIYISIGNSVNLRDVCPLFTISAGSYSTIQLSRYFTVSSTLYFNGVTSNTIIKIYKQ